jgi:hypothetical protein
MTIRLEIAEDDLERVLRLMAAAGLKVPAERVERAGPKLPDCPVQKLVALWAEVMPELPEMEIINEQRSAQLRARWREWAAAGKYSDTETGLDHWRQFFVWLRKSSFLMGKTKPMGDRPVFVMSLDWLTRSSNWAKALEGKYHAA